MTPKYHKKSRLVAGIFLACSPVIIGLLRVINTLVFWLSKRADTEKMDMIKGLINRILGILGYASILGCILGIILLVTYKPKNRVLADGE